MGFDTSISKLLNIEGGYSNRPSDRGGKTRWGIIEDTARANGYSGDMAQLPLDTAKRIYKGQYWDLLRLDSIAPLSDAVADELFDTGVNCGVGVAATFLQRALNVFSRQHDGGRTDYPLVVVDGVMGPRTIHSLRAYLAQRGKTGETVLLRALNALQGARYINLGERDTTQKDNEFGWFANRVTI